MAMTATDAADPFRLQDIEQALAAVSAQEQQQAEALVAEAVKTAASAQQALKGQMIENARLELESQQQSAQLEQNLAFVEADNKQLVAIIETNARTIAQLQAELQAARTEIAKRDAASPVRVIHTQPTCAENAVHEHSRR